MNNTLKATLAAGLKELHLPTVRECYEQTAQRAEQESITYEQFLLELTEQELAARRHKKTQKLLKLSQLPLEKNFESYDFQHLPSKLALQAKTLMSGQFLDKKENVLAFGNLFRLWRNRTSLSLTKLHAPHELVC